MPLTDGIASFSAWFLKAISAVLLLSVFGIQRGIRGFRPAFLTSVFIVGRYRCRISCILFLTSAKGFDSVWKNVLSVLLISQVLHCMY